MARFDPRRLPPAWGTEEETLLQAIDDATATPVEVDHRLAGGMMLALDRLLALHQQLARESSHERLGAPGDLELLA